MSKNVKKGIEPRLRFPEFKKAGDWEEKSLDDVGEVITGSTPSTSVSEYYGGNNLFVSPADINENRFVKETKTTLSDLGFSKTRHVPEKSILFVCIGSTIGKIAQNFVECATNQQINSVIPKDEYDNGFIYYALSGSSEKIAKLAGRQAVPIINKTQFSATRIVSPKKNEQKKIADCLSSLDEVIAAQGEKVEALKTYKKGLLQQLFPQEGQTTPTLRFPEFKKSGDWIESTVEGVVDTITPPKKIQTMDYLTEGKYPIIDQSQDYICGWTEDQTALIKNNLPLIIFGDHTCILKLAKEPFAQGADGIKILKADTKLDPIFLYQNLQSYPLVMKEYKRHFSDLKEKKIFYPKNKEEQKKIAECLSSLDEVIINQIKYLESLILHKKGLLQQLFPSNTEVNNG